MASNYNNRLSWNFQPLLWAGPGMFICFCGVETFLHCILPSSEVDSFPRTGSALLIFGKSWGSEPNTEIMITFHFSFRGSLSMHQHIAWDNVRSPSVSRMTLQPSTHRLVSAHRKQTGPRFRENCSLPWATQQTRFNSRICYSCHRGVLNIQMYIYIYQCICKYVNMIIYVWSKAWGKGI